MKKKIILSAFFGFSLFSQTLFAKSDLETLKQEVSWLKQSVENSNQKVAEAMNNLTTMQQQFASIKGALESGGYLQEEQKKSLREYDQRMQAMEDKIGNLVNLLNEMKEGRLSEKTVAADETQTKEFQRLLDLVSAEDYSKALPGFQAFVQKNPKSSLADNAQYWIAECYYSSNDYKKAIAEYQTLIQKYPRSTKIKTALLKQGLSFVGLKMYAEAKPFFEKVMNEYPNTSESAKASQKVKEIDRLLATSSGSAPAQAPSSNPKEGGSSTPNSLPNRAAPSQNSDPAGLYQF